MAFTIPDQDEPIAPAPQSNIFQVDIDTIIAGIKGAYSAASGGAVSQRAAGANMSVDVAASVTLHAGIRKTRASTTNVAVTAAHATLPRLDLVVVTSAGAAAVRAGTPAAVTSLKPPNLTAGDTLLASLYVPAAVTSIVDAYLTDRRVNPASWWLTNTRLVDGDAFPLTRAGIQTATNDVAVSVMASISENDVTGSGSQVCNFHNERPRNRN